MKSLNQYIIEVQDPEISLLISEVLENNYTNEEIEDSFDGITLFFENLEMKDIKDYIAKYKEWDNKNNDHKAKEIAKLNDEYNKKLTEIGKKKAELKMPWAINFSDVHEFHKALKKYQDNIQNLSNEYNNTSKELAQKVYDIQFNKSNNLPSNDDIKTGWYCYCFAFLHSQINEVIKTRKKQKEQSEAFFNDKEGKTPPALPTDFTNINKTMGTYLKGLSDQLKKDKDNEVLSEILNDFCKLLKLDKIYIISKDGIKINNDELNNYTYQQAYGIDKAPKDGGTLLYDTNTKKWIVKDESIEAVAQDKELTSEESNSEESNSSETQSEEDQKEQTTDVIKSNKDLLTPLAKEANITGEQLLKIINKSVLNKKGEARKLDDQVILGLSIMLCGMILSVKKSGKKDNAAIKAILEKITKTLSQKQSIDKFINQNK